MTTEGVLESKSIFDKCCLELKNTLENMWGETNIWNFELWPLSHRTLPLNLSRGIAISKDTKQIQKSLIRETKHLSTDADSSTDTTVGWTKNIQKPEFIEKKEKNSSKMEKLKNLKKYAKTSDTPFDQRSLIHREAWFPHCFVRQNQPNKTIFFGDFRPLPNKNVQIWDHFFPLLFAKDSESLKILDIWCREVGAKRRLNCTSKVNRRTDGRTEGQTDTQTDILTYRKHRPRGPMLWKSQKAFCLLKYSEMTKIQLRIYFLRRRRRRRRRKTVCSPPPTKKINTCSFHF